MQTIKRLNANIPVELYSEVKLVLKDQGKTITELIIEAMKKAVYEYKMVKMVDLYNQVAASSSTEEAMKWEELCVSDGLNLSEDV